MPETAEAFIAEASALRDPARAVDLQRYFKTGPGEYGEGDEFLGLRMAQVTALAKQSLGMPVEQLELLLESPLHEVRTGAITIMHLEAKAKRTTDARRKQLFDLYLRRHDRINNWDLVDGGCRYVVGGYLFDRPRDILYSLARSPSLWERRTAMISTWFFIRAGQTDDALAIAEILLGDREDLIHKATGWMLRDVGAVNRPAVLAFLDEHAATMPRTALRYSIEKFGPEDRAHYLSLGKA